MRNIFNNFKTNTKKLWQTLNGLTSENVKIRKSNDITHNNKLITDSKAKAEHFNNFFGKIAEQLDKELPKSTIDPLSFLIGNYPNDMPTPETNIREVLTIIKSLKTKGCHVNDFSTLIIKENAHLIAAPIVQLFNQSVSQGTFPNVLKAARIIPIFKKGSKTDSSNYRPISLLNIFSKIFEKIMKIYLVNFLNEFRIINPSQYGFQKGKNTLDALTQFSKYLHENLNKSEFVISIFVDFCKAFDVVPHDILLKKLEHYGIRGIINQWFSDYLANRTHRTIIDDKVSNSIKITMGVPQGSVLGPILFNIFINDLPTFSDILKTILFADDANLFKAGTNPIDLIITANIELYNFYNWCVSNRITINAIKTNFMLFSNIAYNQPLPPLLIKSYFHYEVVKRVTENKFLGIFFDENLTFKKHVKHLTQRLTRTSSLIYQMKSIMPSFVLKTIYNAHISSILSYCNIIWSGTNKVTLKPLITLQKRIIRNITHSPFDAHTQPLFTSCNIMNVNALRIYNLGIYFFKNHLNDLVQYQGNHGYHTRYRNHLRPVIHRTATFRRSYIFQSVELWEYLTTFHPDIANATSLNSFKRRLKKGLIQGSIIY